MSRNQREGKFIPGWCYNPAYKAMKDKDGNTVSLIAKRRAGGNHTLVAVRMFNDNGYIIPGVTYVRYIREGAYK